MKLLGIACGVLALLVARPADSQWISGGFNGSQQVCPPVVASVGNGADLTEDLLQTCTVPANTLLNVGDQLSIVAGGRFASSTDAKTVRVRLGGASGTVMVQPNGGAAGTTQWTALIYVQKTGSSAQSFTSIGGVTTAGNNNGSLNSTSSQTDTAAIDIIVTGQNSTNSVSGSVTCNYLTVYYRPSGS